MDYILNLITSGNVDELSKKVFNQHLSPQSVSGYTQCLNTEEEIALIHKLLEPDCKKWLDFASNYVEHYPLSGSAVINMAEHIDKPSVRTLFEDNLKKYGAGESESLAICKQLRSKDKLDAEFLAVFCDSARQNYDRVVYELALIGEKWWQRYVDAVKAYQLPCR